MSTVEDRGGALIGQPLHLSLHPYAWWLEQFRKRECVLHWSQDFGPACAFYLTAWKPGQWVVDGGEINTDLDTLCAQVRHNIGQGWRQVTPHELQDAEVMILGGGPSLAQFEGEIKAMRAAGAKLVTMGGAYNWALDHGLTPSATICVDAREMNQRFTKPVVDDCIYLISSQCHPKVLEGLPTERTYLWHTTNERISEILQAQYPTCYPIPGGSTVLLRALPLLRTLGFKWFHLYGCDSCLTGEKHHAFSQPENDDARVFNVIVQPSGRIFRCHSWMVAQATEFVSMVRAMGNEFEVQIHGDGLLQHIIETGASLAPVGEG